MTDYRAELIRRHAKGMQPVQPLDPGPLNDIAYRNKLATNRWRFRMGQWRLAEWAQKSGISMTTALEILTQVGKAFRNERRKRRKETREPDHD